jgi:hypothetical protein
LLLCDGHSRTEELSCLERSLSLFGHSSRDWLNAEAAVRSKHSRQHHCKKFFIPLIDFCATSEERLNIAEKAVYLLTNDISKSQVHALSRNKQLLS